MHNPIEAPHREPVWDSMFVLKSLGRSLVTSPPLSNEHWMFGLLCLLPKLIRFGTLGCEI